MSTYKTYGYAMVNYSMDKLVAAVAPRQQAQRPPQRRTIGAMLDEADND